MKARLIREDSGDIKLLCPDGTINTPDSNMLRSLLFDFKNSSSFSGTDGNWLSTSLDMSMYPGETLAYVADDLSLVISDPTEFESAVNITPLESYISISEYAKKVNKSIEIIKVMCRSGRIKGAKKVNGRCWLIPEDAPYPVSETRQRIRKSLL